MNSVVLMLSVHLCLNDVAVDFDL